MAYISKNLADGEEVHHSGSLSRIFWFNCIVLFGVAVLIGLGTQSLPIFAVFFLLALIIALRMLSTEIAITDRRVIYKKGILLRTVTDIPLGKIELTRLRQGILARIFRYGDLELRGTGLGSIFLKNLDDPIEFKRALDDSLSIQPKR